MFFMAKLLFQISKQVIMKQITNMFFVAIIFFFFSCSSDTADKGTGNNTTSGSYATGNSDSANLHDTLHPVQPNGMDTSAEQTGRMNNTSRSAARSQAKDSNKTKK